MKTFYADASEKLNKVDAEIAKAPDADPPDLDTSCAYEKCLAGTQHCLPMSGHESALQKAKWRTCCPVEMPVAGKRGACCHEVGSDGVCIW